MYWIPGFKFAGEWAVIYYERRICRLLGVLSTSQAHFEVADPLPTNRINFVNAVVERTRRVDAYELFFLSAIGILLIFGLSLGINLVLLGFSLVVRLDGGDWEFRCGHRW